MNFPDRKKQAEFAKIDYATEIAPLLADKCVVCHTQGGMGPFGYEPDEVEAWLEARFTGK